MDILKECMNMIAFSGEAKSLTLQAIKEARNGQFEQCNETLKKADKSLVKGYQAHTNLLVHEAQENDIQVSILMMHSADHLNSAETIRILANEIIAIHESKEVKHV